MKLIYSKICLILIITFLSINVASAVNPDDFKVPSGFEIVEFNFDHPHSESFVNSYDEGITIYNYSDEDKDLLFTETDTYILDDYENNIYIFVDGESGLCGYIECIEHNGQKFAIQSSCSSEDAEDHGLNIRENILEFNEINNFTPIPV